MRIVYKLTFSWGLITDVKVLFELETFTLGPLQSMSSLQSVEYWHLSPTLKIFPQAIVPNYDRSQDKPSPGTLAGSPRDKWWSRFSGSKPAVFLTIRHFHVRARPKQKCLLLKFNSEYDKSEEAFLRYLDKYNTWTDNNIGIENNAYTSQVYMNEWIPIVHEFVICLPIQLLV